jgi:hypothetical protein
MEDVRAAEDRVTQLEAMCAKTNRLIEDLLVEIDSWNEEIRNEVRADKLAEDRLALSECESRLGELSQELTEAKVTCSRLAAASDAAARDQAMSVENMLAAAREAESGLARLVREVNEALVAACAAEDQARLAAARLAEDQARLAATAARAQTAEEARVQAEAAQARVVAAEARLEKAKPGAIQALAAASAIRALAAQRDQLEDQVRLDQVWLTVARAALDQDARNAEVQNAEAVREAEEALAKMLQEADLRIRLTDIQMKLAMKTVKLIPDIQIIRSETGWSRAAWVYDVQVAGDWLAKQMTRMGKIRIKLGIKKAQVQAARQQLVIILGMSQAQVAKRLAMISGVVAKEIHVLKLLQSVRTRSMKADDIRSILLSWSAMMSGVDERMSVRVQSIVRTAVAARTRILVRMVTGLSQLTSAEVRADRLEIRALEVQFQLTQAELKAQEVQGERAVELARSESLVR